MALSARERTVVTELRLIQEEMRAQMGHACTTPRQACPCHACRIRRLLSLLETEITPKIGD